MHTFKLMLTQMQILISSRGKVTELAYLPSCCNSYNYPDSDHSDQWVHCSHNWPSYSSERGGLPGSGAATSRCWSGPLRHLCASYSKCTRDHLCCLCTPEDKEEESGCRSCQNGKDVRKVWKMNQIWIMWVHLSMFLVQSNRVDSKQRGIQF